MEVNPISKKEIKWSDYKKVPILKVDGEHMVDSSGSLLFLNLLLTIFWWFHIFSHYKLTLVYFVYFPDIIDKLFHRINPDSSILDGDEEKKWREENYSIKLLLLF